MRAVPSNIPPPPWPVYGSGSRDTAPGCGCMAVATKQRHEAIFHPSTSTTHTVPLHWAPTPRPPLLTTLHASQDMSQDSSHNHNGFLTIPSFHDSPPLVVVHRSQQESKQSTIAACTWHPHPRLLLRISSGTRLCKGVMCGTDTCVTHCASKRLRVVVLYSKDAFDILDVVDSLTSFRVRGCRAQVSNFSFFCPSSKRA